MRAMKLITTVGIATILIGMLFPFVGIAAAQQLDPERPLKASYEIADGGMQRQLEVSMAEVAVKQADGRRTITQVTDENPAAKAKQLRTKAAAEVEIVLIESGGDPKSREAAVTIRHFVTREVLVKLKAGAAAKVVAKKAGLRVSREMDHAPGFVILDARTSEGALVAMETLRLMPEVESADVLLATQKAKKKIPNDPLFSEQWHLRNTTQLGGALWADANVTSVWDTFEGSGITIGIIDDGVQHAHPDIQPNYNTSLDYDYNSNDSDPTPVNLTEDSHGTACAGVAAARGGNGIGVTGAAPLATLTGFRLIAAPTTDQNEADAFLANNNSIQVKSNSWGQPDGGGYGGPGLLAAAALETAVTSGRGGKGVIQLFSGGNGFHLGDNSNYDGYANSPFVIAVAAVNDAGFQSYYSEMGANLLISAPSNSGGQNEGIRTVDLTGDSGYNQAASGANNLSDRNYTNDFGGTSSACPLAAGIVALMLEANPNLGWRDVKEILVRTARKAQRTDPDWATNGAGLSFNHKYGAGVIDAAAAVALAQQWTNLPAMTTTQVAQTGLSTAIPDNNATGVTRTLNFTASNFRVEHVTVTVNATHTARGDLEVTLTSPSGMVSKLAQSFNDGTDNLAWTYSSVRHWGESAAGNWTVKVADRAALDAGTLTGVTVKLWGTTNAGARLAGAGATLSGESNTPANSAADPGEAVTFSLGLKNIGAAATSNLTATLLPIGGVREPSVAQNYGALAASGATVQRSFSFRIAGGTGVSVPVILRLSDGATDLGFANLDIPLGTSASNTFTGGAITIRDKNTGSPSPSDLPVSGLVGRVQDMTARINGLTHSFVDDVGALLHSPDDLKIRLFCGGNEGSASSANLTFDDAASITFPASQASLSTGTYRPLDYYGPFDAADNPSGRSFTGDTGSKELAFTMSEFRGVPADGTWKLFMQDFSAGDAGSLTSWQLSFTTVTSTDNVFLTTATTSGSEGSGSIDVSVTRTGGREGSATVNYATSNGTAAAGSDFTSTTGTLTFAAGELTKTFAIPITDDGAVEPDETIQITLSNAGGNTTLGTLATGSVSIMNNDVATPVAISPATQTINEAATTLTFTVSRTTAGSAGNVSYATSGGTATPGTDFTTASGTLTFGTGDLSKTFSVSVINDDMLEPDEGFSVSLSGATGSLSLGSPAIATVTIVDGDADNDTMADDYESSVGLNPAIHDAALDLDGDGSKNIDEFLFGSLPNNAGSRFQFSVAVGSMDVSVTFPSITGRIYKVERSETLDPPWATVQENLAGTGANITITETGTASRLKGFYRVVVRQP